MGQIIALVAALGFVAGLAGWLVLRPRPARSGRTSDAIPPSACAGSSTLGAHGDARQDFDLSRTRAELDVARVEMANLRAMLEAQITVDTASGLANSRGFEQRLKLEFNRTKRYKLPFSVMRIHIEGLERCAPELGDDGRNAMIANIGAALRTSLSDTDMVAFLGGGQFAALVIETEGAEALALAESTRARACELNVGGRPSICSIGLTSMRLELDEPSTLVVEAETALAAAMAACGNGSVSQWTGPDVVSRD